MKAVICSAAGPVHIHTPGTSGWVICQCGNTGVKWEDPQAGRLVVASRNDLILGAVRVLGLNNQMLLPAIGAPHRPNWAESRAWHDVATDAPGFVFDKSRGGCWAVVFGVGSTGDTRWASPAETRECFTS